MLFYWWRKREYPEEITVAWSEGCGKLLQLWLQISPTATGIWTRKLQRWMPSDQSTRPSRSYKMNIFTEIKCNNLKRRLLTLTKQTNPVNKIYVWYEDVHQKYIATLIILTLRCISITVSYTKVRYIDAIHVRRLYAFGKSTRTLFCWRNLQPSAHLVWNTDLLAF